MRKNYFIQQYLEVKYVHGGVGGADAEQVLINKGFIPVMFPHQHNFSPRAKISRFLYLLKTVLKIGKGAVVVFIFPVYARMNQLLIRILSRRKDIRLACFIADINGLKDGNERILREEIAYFKKFRYFIIHNEGMMKWLQQEIKPRDAPVAIEFFDYLTDPANKKSEPGLDILFAGNLGKSRFLEQLHRLDMEHSGLRFHLYGPGVWDAVLKQDNVTYHGIIQPYELPGKTAGSFGLLWDGDSIDRPGGSLGHYMQYISHHKLSLYIMSGLPVIVPAMAGSAGLINRYNIGITINNLHEIKDKLSAISPGQYRQMQLNLRSLAARISRGDCLGRAIDELLKQIDAPLSGS